MAPLTSAHRHHLRSSQFAGPHRSYPVNNRAHAANAKARAHQQYNKGHLSGSAYHHIVAKANKLLDKHAEHKARLKHSLRHHRHVSKHGHDDAHHHISRHGYDDAHTVSAHPRPYYDERGGGGHPFWSHGAHEAHDRTLGRPNAHPTDHHNNPHYAMHGHEPHSRDDHYHVGKGRFDRLTAPEHSPSIVDVQHSRMSHHDRPMTSAVRPDRYARDYDQHELRRHDGGLHQEGRNPPNQQKSMSVGRDDGYDGDTNLAVYAQHIYDRDNISRHTGRQDRYGRDLDAHQLYRHERVAREHSDTHYPNLAKPMAVGFDDGYDADDGGPHSTYNQGIYDRNNRTTRGARR